MATESSRVAPRRMFASAIRREFIGILKEEVSFPRSRLGQSAMLLPNLARVAASGYGQLTRPLTGRARYLSADSTSTTPSPEHFLASLTEALRDRYSIKGEIGRGGMARVYLARDARHERDVAIKVLDPELSSVLGSERFLREIRLTAQLTHPNVIPLLDSGQAGDLLYYVTPFAPGETLRARLARDHQLPVRDALRIAREIADALDAAHRLGIVHRDIKPENILLIAGHAVVCDFGIARALSAAANHALTATGVSLGTPAYMAPEQVLAQADLDGRADIYALGCVLYEMLAGDPPFTGSNAQRIMAQHATSAVPSVRLARPAVSESIDRLLNRALQKTPVDRYATASELRDALDAMLETGDTKTTRGRTWRAAAAVAVIAVGAVSGLWYRSRHPSSDVSARDRDPTASRVAVLPMANLSPDPDDRYFADGMTEQLISTLSSIAGLRVIARSSILSYAGTRKTAAEIGRELHVGHIVESSCRKIGNELHVTVRLVDAASDEQRWNEDYDREATLTNILAIQREISTVVAQKLRVRLMPADSARVAKRPTENLEAYGLYVRAQVMRHDRVNSLALRATLDTSGEMLQRAIALDSSFAEAHTALAQTYIARLFQFEPNSDLRQRAQAEIAKAIALDPQLAEAYAARGDLEFTRETGWQLEAAMRDYRRAVALEPNSADIHAAYGTLLFHVGLLDVARRELELTMLLDPANRFVPPRISRVMWYGRQYDSALARMNRGLGFPEEHALVLGYVGRPASGLDTLDHAAPTGRSEFDNRAARAVLLARLGRTADAEKEINAAIPKGPTASHFHHAEFMIASAYSLLGKADESRIWLERMANNGMPNYELIAADPSLANARAAPAFRVFLARERARNERLRMILMEERTNEPR
jgi:eukaryotic-like serine/threonine-protein kinase